MAFRADVVVIGAGPAGAAAALAHARNGARVILMEAHPQPKRKLSGELLHPTGLSLLRKIGVDVTPGNTRGECRGFAVFTGDSEEPIILPYPRNEKGVAGEHADLVTTIREQALGHPSIQLLSRAQCLGVRHRTVNYAGPDGSEGEVHAERIVGAMGRFSVLRRRLGSPPQKRTLSHMAGFLLRDVSLPCEGFGHLFLGGPGPALIYRIAPDAVRVCLDVPTAWRTLRDRRERIWEGYQHVLPRRLRLPLREKLDHEDVLWAVNEVAPRLSYGAGSLALIGDSVGHFHPMTACGMTLALGDALCLSRSRSVGEYATQRRRDSLVPALTATGLYDIFSIQHDAARRCRSAIFHMWRTDPFERKRTMDFLTCRDTGLHHLLQTCSKFMSGALLQLLKSTLMMENWNTSYDSLLQFGNIARWLFQGVTYPQFDFHHSDPAATPLMGLRQGVKAAAG